MRTLPWKAIKLHRWPASKTDWNVCPMKDGKCYGGCIGFDMTQYNARAIAKRHNNDVRKERKK